MTRMLTRLLTWVADQVDRFVGWSRLPTVLAVPMLIGIRAQLRARNLYDTRGPSAGGPAGHDPHAAEHRTARTIDGSYNKLTDPLVGATGCRFGRNVPLTHVYR
ncbi:MAG TPA: peroxidase, partial [Mycobacterium sp.]|nr:peroxidase [Mycobacterium sp.]